MALLASLKEVENFVYTSTLYELLENELNLKVKKTKNPQFDVFTKNTLVLVYFDEKKYKTSKDFTDHIRKVLHAKGTITKKNIDIFMHEHIASLDKNSIDRKGIEKNNNTISQNFNISVKHLISDDFETLLCLCGEALLSEILRETVFLTKHDHIFVQLTGKPLQTLFDRPKPAGKFEKYKGKKIISNEQILRSNVDRNSFLYCLHSNKRVDFFHKSVLYRKKVLMSKKKASYRKQNMPNMNSIMKDARGNALYSEIFDSYYPNKATKAALSSLLAKVLSNYEKLDLDKLYRKFCPFDFENYARLKQKLSELKARVVNKSKFKETQKEIAEAFSELTRMTVNEMDIVRFIKAVMHLIFPKQYFGEVKPGLKKELNKKKTDRAMEEGLKQEGDSMIEESVNENIIQRINNTDIIRTTNEIINYYIKKIVCMKRFESISYAEILEELKFNKFDWYCRKYNKFWKSSIHKERNFILTRLIHFFFTNLLELIKANFYVTEKHNEHNKLFYYCKSVWYMISQYGILHMEIQNLKKVDDKDELNPTRLLDRPIAKLRFVPKNDSLRPIMTFYRRFKDTKTNKMTRMQHYLLHPKIVLRSIKLVLSQNYGFSVFDNHQIFAKLEPFVKRWKEKNKPFIYAASLDIKKCYDSVSLENMFEFIRKEKIFEELYFINNFFKIMRNKRFYFGEKTDKKKMSNLFLGKKRDASNMLDELCKLSTFFKDKIILKDQTVFCDAGAKSMLNKQELLDKLMFVCSSVYVKFGKSYFELERGLPQGLSVSSVLSSFYYSILEYYATKELIEEMERKKVLYLVMRLTDDYLILCEDEQYTTRLVETLLEISNKEGFEFNEKKLKSNFYVHPKFKVEEDAFSFKWIGKTFDLKKMEVEHTQIVEKEEAFYTVNVNLPTNIKLIPDFLKGKLKTFFLNQNTFYFNSAINSDEKIMSLLPGIMTSAYYKLSTYINMLAICSGYEICRTPLYLGVVSNKLVETLIDCAYIVEKTSKKLKVRELVTFMIDCLINMFTKDCDNKIKHILKKQLAKRKEDIADKVFKFYE